MTAMPADLSGFLRGIGANPGDNARRLVFADWLDEKFPATPVTAGLPTGFVRVWRESGANARLGSHLRHQQGGRGPLSKSDIIHAFMNWPFPEDTPCRHTTWFDHGGWTTIAGVPVVVSEPYGEEGTLLAACELLQRVIGFPVAYSRSAAWYKGCRRITLWHTAWQFCTPEPDGEASG